MPALTTDETLHYYAAFLNEWIPEKRRELEAQKAKLDKAKERDDAKAAKSGFLSTAFGEQITDEQLPPQAEVEVPVIPAPVVETEPDHEAETEALAINEPDSDAPPASGADETPGKKKDEYMV